LAVRLADDFPPAKEVEHNEPDGDEGTKEILAKLSAMESRLAKLENPDAKEEKLADEDDENKMGNKAKRHAPDAGISEAEFDTLVQAGRDASLTGTASLNKWWASLTPRQQKDMGQDFGAMRKAARTADEGVKR
jgi:hypothetical protein